MRPRLVGTRGPLNGASFEIADSGATIGRGAGSTIAVSDGSVSRRHCSIERAGDGWQVVDHGSRNGTFVNGVAVERRRLEDGDEVRVGHSTLLFLDSREPDSQPLSLDGSRIDTRAVVRFRPEESVYLKPDAPAPARSGMGALVRLAAAARSCQGAKPLAEAVLALAADAIPAGRGGVVLLHKGCAIPDATYFWQRSPQEAEPAAPREIVERVAEEGAALLCRRVPEGSAASVALVAAPIGAGPPPAGVLYLEATDESVCLSEDHLQWLAAVGCLLAPVFADARELDRLRQENRRLESELRMGGDMVGHGPAARTVYQFVAKAAPSDATILIHGETGTGKELAARAIHRNSRRASGPFIAINCATLGEALLESELFGHERGAFTGAVAQKKGKMELADGGTLFLDEIGELPANVQAKLLRALQERQIERVGGTRSVPVNFRLIAATNRDLRRAVAENRFREDLYFRLKVVELRMPPLRERVEDIPALAEHFVERCRQRFRPGLKGLTREAIACLKAYSWPGNIRELENAIERAAVLGEQPLIRPEDLPDCVLEASPPAAAAGSFCDGLNEQKRRMILAALEDTHSYAGAAARLGICTNSLHRLIRNLGIRDRARALVREA